jgi:hypothetical protein
MTRVRVVLAAMLAVAMLAVVASSASASVASASSTTKFCKAAAKIGTNASNASGFTKGKAKKLSTQFKNAAKYAPAKVKSAVNNITNLLNAIAKTGVSDLPKVYSSDAFKKYPAAVTTFFTYQANACAGTS